MISFDIFLQHTEFQSLFEWRHIWNEQIFYVFSSNQILWDPCYGVVYPTWEYIESYGTYKWHHVHIWQGVQCIHQMSLYILLSFPLTFNHIRISETPNVQCIHTTSLYILPNFDLQRHIWNHVCLYAYMLHVCRYAYICFWKSKFHIHIWTHVWETPASNVFTAHLYIFFPILISWKSKFHMYMESCLGDPSVQCIHRTSLYPHPAFFVSHNICLCDIFVSSL